MGAAERDWLFISRPDDGDIDMLKPPKVKDIISAVEKAFSVSKIQICSKRRHANLCQARHAVCYLARGMTRQSLPAIGRMLGDRDHTTVLHSVRKAEQLAASDRQFGDKLAMARVMVMRG